MSARHPSQETKVYTFHGNPEPVLAILWERGHTIGFDGPMELTANTISLVVDATRQEMREAREEDTRRVTQYHGSDYATPEPVSRQREYNREEDGTRHLIRVYFDPAVIVDTLRKHGLSGDVAHLRPYHCFRMVRVNCPRPQFRAAQAEWLQRLMLHPPAPLETAEALDIFA